MIFFKKLLKKFGIMKKSVKFDLEKNSTRVMYTYAYAMAESRNGKHWRDYMRDSMIFNFKIKEIEKTVEPILDIDHRKKIYHERFVETTSDERKNFMFVSLCFVRVVTCYNTHRW